MEKENLNEHKYQTENEKNEIITKITNVSGTHKLILINQNLQTIRTEIIDVIHEIDTTDLEFKISIDYKILRKVLKIAKLLNSEIKLDLAKDGIHIHVINGIHTALEDIFIPAIACVEYDIGSRDHIYVGIDLTSIPILQNNLVTVSSVNVDYETDIQTYEHKIVVTRKKQIKSIAFVQNSIMDERTVIPNNLMYDPKIPELTYSTGASITMIPTQLPLFIDRAKTISDIFRITITPKLLVLTAKNDSNKITMTLISKDETDIKLPTGTEKITSSYNLEYIKKFIKLLPNGTNMFIQINNDYPLSIIVKLQPPINFLTSQQNRSVQITCILAPCLEYQ